ncbi:YceI family protein [Aquimarina sp. RZ0]|uniref:YceI family protein n=1 Tax=Aquimarina sp. RZ0 TaxID=2607730 RepID=UPI002107300F|nr:YceI family protein [Aquimarina sp. RZ0]
MFSYKSYSSQVDIVINVNSLDTNHETRDKHLIGSMWLDAKSYPEIKFISSSIRKEDINKYRIEGSLTIKNITKKK